MSGAKTLLTTRIIWPVFDSPRQLYRLFNHVALPILLRSITHRWGQIVLAIVVRKKPLVVVVRTPRDLPTVIHLTSLFSSFSHNHKPKERANMGRPTTAPSPSQELTKSIGQRAQLPAFKFPSAAAVASAAAAAEKEEGELIAPLRRWVVSLDAVKKIS